MAGRGTGKGTLVGSFTRTVFVVGVCLTFGTGVGLFAVPGGRRTIGLGRSRHRSRLRSSVLATWEPRWLCSLLQGPGNGAARAVLAFTLTSLALLDTLRNLRPFAFGEGGLIEAVTWIWLAVYVALPPLLLVAFVRQERAGGAAEYGNEYPALAVSRLVLGAAGALVAFLGVALLADWGWLTGRWPWPLPSLPATVVGAWFCTVAAGLLWFALRERDWSRARLGVAPITIALALDLVAAVRLRHTFVGGGPPASTSLASLSCCLRSPRSLLSRSGGFTAPVRRSSLPRNTLKAAALEHAVTIRAHPIGFRRHAAMGPTRNRCAAGRA